MGKTIWEGWVALNLEEPQQIALSYQRYPAEMNAGAPGVDGKGGLGGVTGVGDLAMQSIPEDRTGRPLSDTTIRRVNGGIGYSRRVNYRIAARTASRTTG